MKKSNIKKSALLFAALLSCAALIQASEITYVADMSLRGGQYILDGSPSSFGGNAAFYFAPIVNFENGDSLIPVFNVNYRGTRDIRELIGGDTLVRQTMDYGLFTKYTRRYTNTAAALRLVAGQSLINETKDETWGSGLFDYRNLMGGAEVSRRFGVHEAFLSADYYVTFFTNYASLVSEIDGDEFGEAIDDSDVYADISGNAGENVLDFRGIALSAGSDSEYGLSALNYSWRLDLRNYPDQALVKSDGSFSSSKRKDTINTLTFSFSRPVQRTVLGVDSEVALVSSNQNSFDAPSAKFLKDFYSHTSWNISPLAVFYLGPELSQLSLKGMVGGSYYCSRLARDEEGNYLDKNILQANIGINASYRYPLTDSLNMSLSLGALRAFSNTKYEGNYRYNYYTINYFTGVDWRY